jgi:hypothetical protein
MAFFLGVGSLPISLKPSLISMSGAFGEVK